MIDKITEDKIKGAANIVDVIGDFVELRKRGVVYQGICPFHDDKHLGSFQVSPKKNIYKCFACGAAGDSVEFLMRYKYTALSYPDALRYLAKKYSIYIDDNNDERFHNIKPAKPREIEEVCKDMLVMPRELVSRVAKSTLPNIFIDWFRSLPWSNAYQNNQQARVQQTLWLYCVGGWTDGRVVFWQIDDQRRPRSGKLMRYNTNGKRDKTSNPGWLHNQEGVRESCDLEHYEYRATLFGMHLLNRYPEADINVVESEKTALICANAYGHPEKNLWMACGGLKFLKIESLQPLIDSGRRVWLWPDKDGIEDWCNKLKDIQCKQMAITTKFLDSCWIEADGPKADVADIILRHMQHPETIVQRKQEARAEQPEWKDGPAFVDLEELTDVRVRRWRNIMSRVKSSGWGDYTEVSDLSAEEVVEQNTILKPLLINEQTRKIQAGRH